MAFRADIINHDPTEDTKTSSSVGVEGSEHRAYGSIEGRTTIEAVPPEPDEDGANEDESGVMRAAVNLVAFG